MELLAENDVLDKHALNLDSPAGSDILDDLANALGQLLAPLDDVLQDTGADDVAQGGLGALDEGLSNICDAEGGLVGGDDVVVDDAREVEVHIVLGHTDLLGDLDDLDLDVHLNEALGEGVDLDEARVDGPVELAKLGDQAYVALLDVLKGVGATDTAGDGTHSSDAGTEGVDCEADGGALTA